MGRRPSLLALVAVGALLLVAGIWWALAPARPALPNVILVVIDSLRADRLEAAADEAGPMPYLAGLAARSVSYERAYAPTSWTLPSIASLFTGRYPSQHGIFWWFSGLRPSETTLAEVLAANGYRTAGFSAHGAISSRSTVTQGFEVFDVAGEPTQALAGDASDVNAAALRWLVSREDRSSPYFLFLHYMDVHLPYRAHRGLTRPRTGQTGADAELSDRVASGAFAEAEERARLWAFTPEEIERLEELYDGEARYLDARLRELLSTLQSRGGLDDAILIVTADHGEEFGEHGVFGHATSLYESVIRVPLFIKLPRGSEAGRVETPVSAAGLASTLFAQLGIDPPESFRAEALPLPRSDEETGHAYAYSELLDTKNLKLRLHARALVTRVAKLLVSPDGDEAVFAAAEEDGARASDPVAAPLRSQLAELDRTLTVEPGAPEEVELDANTIERLRALGYQE